MDNKDRFPDGPQFAIVIQPENDWTQPFPEFNGHHAEIVSSKSIYNVLPTSGTKSARRAENVLKNDEQKFLNNNCEFSPKLDKLKCGGNINSEWLKTGNKLEYPVPDSKPPVKMHGPALEKPRQMDKQGVVHQAVPQEVLTDPAAPEARSRDPTAPSAPADRSASRDPTAPAVTAALTDQAAPAARLAPQDPTAPMGCTVPAGLVDHAAPVFPTAPTAPRYSAAPVATPVLGDSTAPQFHPAPLAPPLHTSIPMTGPILGNPMVPTAPAVLAAFGALASQMPAKAPVPPIVSTVLAGLGYPVTPTAPSVAMGFSNPASQAALNAPLGHGPGHGPPGNHEAPTAHVPPIVSTVLEALRNPVLPIPPAPFAPEYNMPISNQVPNDTNTNGQSANNTNSGSQADPSQGRKRTTIYMYSRPRIVNAKSREISATSPPTPDSATISASIQSPGTCPCCCEGMPPCPCRIPKQSIGTQYEDNPFQGKKYTKEECKTVGTDAFLDVSVSINLLGTIQNL